MLKMGYVILFLFPGSKPLPGEIGQNMKAYAAGEGISFELKRWPCGCEAGLEGTALWFWLICRAKAMCGKGSILLYRILVLFFKKKNGM